MRLIDADRLLGILEREEKLHSDIPTRADGIRDAIMDVISAPTVEAVPVVHGRWIRVYSRPGVFKYLGWTCDQCGQRTGNEYAPQYYKFCPYCGAKMNGEGNGNETDRR